MNLVARNKKAEAFYKVDGRLEAGMILTGAEVKTLRGGNVDFNGAYVSFAGETPLLIGLTIPRYRYSADPEYKPKRERKLLLTTKEAHRLMGLSHMKGVTILPLAVYFKNHFAKVEIGVCQMMNKHDRREKLKKRAVEHDVAVELRGKQ